MHEGNHGPLDRAMVRRHYWMLGANLLLSGIAMYLVMFTMIWSAGDFFNNLNTFYMTVMMVAPMAVLMIVMMPMMYPNRQLNLVLQAAFALAFLLAFAAMRDQSFVDDRQFLRSMIPHHSGAVLMCREAPVRDPEIVELCGKIIVSQEAEIAQMKAMLARSGG